MFDDLKEKLARERRSRERIELFNTKLLHELAEVNLLAKQFMTNYEKEKKERELIAELCNELVTQIGEDKAKLKVLSNSIDLCEEVEEERKMMQMADLWREEREQMKLVDAQLVLEEKYNQMVQLIDFLQMFLISRGSELDTTELKDVELIKQAVESVNIQRIVELSYDFSKSNDIVSIFETHDGEGFNKNSMFHQSSSSTVEDRKFSSTPQKGDTYLINVNQDNDISESEAECSEKACLKFLKTGVNRVCSNSISAEQTKWKASPAASKRGTTTISSKSFQHKRARQRNPHITRGMKGCLEWPRGIPKSHSKVIPLEEIVKSQKSQLQHILKHKA
ncbi:uncharacterized protein LOC113852165 [Abrus precatorius]|uniref:Uncharacterized protein LOC113852165 n=1 Tax=Abrus precatorius TaxID=3816 RepID=A0A8B8K3A7_ABRPR|nr:uncharacterized protein LOC113852165 [Abrus precatorius]